MLIARMLRHTGAGTNDMAVFLAKSVEPISSELAMIAQADLGYPVEVFEFFNFKVEQIENQYVASWTSYCNAGG